MQYQPGSNFNRTFLTPAGIGQSLIDAGVGYPVAYLRRNGINDGAVNPVITHVATGIYSVSGTIPSSYVDGDEVELLFIYRIVISNPDQGHVAYLGMMGKDQSNYESHDDNFTSKDT